MHVADIAVYDGSSMPVNYLAGQPLHVQLSLGYQPQQQLFNESGILNLVHEPGRGDAMP